MHRAARSWVYRLESDQHVPRLMQRCRRAVPREGFRRGTDRVGEPRNLLRGGHHSGLLGAADIDKRAEHVHQPGEPAPGQHEKPDTPWGQVLGRDARAGRAGEHEHVGPRRSDRQGIADQHRRHRDHGHSQYTGPWDLGGPVTQCNRQRETHRDNAQVCPAIQVRSAAAVQGRERANRRHQTGREVLCSQPIRAGTAMQAAARSANGHRFCTSFTMNIWRIGLRTGLGGGAGSLGVDSSGGSDMLSLAASLRDRPVPSIPEPQVGWESRSAYRVG